MESLILILFFFFFTIDRIVSFGLDFINLRHIRKFANQVPDFFQDSIDLETYRKSTVYTIDKNKFSQWCNVFDTIVTIWFLFGGLLPWLENWSESYELNPIWTGMVFIAGFGVIFLFIGLPMEWYSIFRIEQKHGFNKMTPSLYIRDKLKELALTIVLSFPFLYVVLWFMAVAGTLWWVWVFGFVMLFQLIMLIVYPLFIAPLFNKFEPMEDGELKQGIIELCEKIKFPLFGVFKMDGSKRSTHSNAYFTGIGKSRRIVLFDTLINDMTTQQAVAVLAHEIGHYKLNHIKKMIVMSSVGLIISLFVLGQIYNYQPLFQAFGLKMTTNHAALVLFMILSTTFTFYLKPVFARISRKHEYLADRFAVNETGDKKHMEESLLKLTRHNLSNLTPHPWYSAFYYSHPAIIERIKAIRAIES